MNEQPIKVLLVEDDQDHAFLTRLALEEGRDPFQVVHIDNGEAVKTRLQEGGYGCVIIDYSLPGKDGLQVMEEVGGAELKVPFIMVTSQGNEHVAVEALKAGAYDYIVKGTGYHVTLPLIIRRCLERYNAKMEKEQLTRKLQNEKEALEQANAELMRMSKLKSEFISTVSHELRTPLTIIKEGIGLVFDEVTGPVNEKQKHFLDVSMKGITRLADLINDLLDLSKLEAGKMEFRKEEALLPQLIEEMVSGFSLTAQSKGIELSSAVSQDMPSVYVDSERTIQVLSNLLNNALKFTPEGGKITVSAMQKTGVPPSEGDTEEIMEAFVGNIVVSVADTGIGISAEDQEQIFDKFIQIGRTPGPGAKGTGLGLAICKEIMRRQNGSIWVESEEEKGSTFSFTVPIYSEELAFRDQFHDYLVKADEKDLSMAVLILNISNLDRIQEDYGKEAAEGLVTKINEMIRSKMRRREDVVLRYRHGEFLAVLAESDGDGARAIAANLKGVLGCHEFDFPVTLQIGAALYPEDGKNRSELVRVAENRLQRFPSRIKKSSGKVERKILVVDDEKDIVELLARRLEEAGYTAFKSYGGQEALDIIKQQYVDLIILDLAMPDISGYEIIGYLKTNKATSDIPILILSAHYADEQELERIGAPAMPRLLKGCDGSIFLETIENLLEHHSA